MGLGRTRPRRAVSVSCGGLLVIGRRCLVWSGIGITADNHDRKWLTDLNAGRGIRAGNAPVCDWTFIIK